MPAAKQQKLVVRHPKAGRWIAAVNAAPFPTSPVAFVLEELISTGVRRQTSTQHGPRPSGSKWTERVELPRMPRVAAAEPGKTPAVLAELIDLALERDEAEHSWELPGPRPKLVDRPVAIGSAIYRLQ
jgi:hypothetical protein